MEDIASEIDRENQIITDLLALVKMDKKVQDLNIVSLNINDLTELILKRLRPIAKRSNVELILESIREVTADVDKVKLNLAVTNLVENAIKYVEANIGRCDLSVEELSRGLGMSRVHLYKKLLQITGKTPIEFIRVIRLKRAAQMLRESQQNVSEIAYQLGFNNP